MEWSDLRVFLAIARTGTLGAAARSLGQTQPTMGRRLRALEGAVGHTLFQRTPDGFVLTDEGRTVLGRAERIEAEVLAFERELNGSELQLEGMLRLSCSEWFGTHVLPPVLAAFSAHHPGVCIELLTDARLYSLPRREADMVFRLGRFEEPGVISRRLMYIPSAVYAPLGFDTSTIEDSNNTRVVTMNVAASQRPDAAWLKRVLPNATVAFRSNNRDVQARFCADGGGLVVLPRPLGDATPGIAPIDLGEAPPGRHTYVGYHKDMRRLPRMRTLLDFVVGRLASSHP